MPLFNPRYKLKVHILQAVLISVVMGLSVPQLFMKGQPRTRANTIALGMGAKSMIIISYQILSEHVARFSRWKSYKAYAILNGLEIVFWAAVIFLVLQANIKSCAGVSCTLRWIAVAVSAVITIVAVYMFIISYIDFRAHRIQRKYHGSRRIMGSNDVEDAQSMNQLSVQPSYACDQEALHKPGKRDHGSEHSARKGSISRSHSHGMERPHYPRDRM